MTAKFEILFTAQIGYVLQANGKKEFRMLLKQSTGHEQLDFTTDGAMRSLDHAILEVKDAMYPPLAKLKGSDQ